jgi:hypothetical protein
MAEKPRNNAAETRPDGMPVGTPFQKGNSGRPKGSRNKLGEDFIADMHEAWVTQGASVIEEVIKKRPQDFLRVVASLLPKDFNINVNPSENMTDDELLERIRRLDSTIQPFLAIEGTAGSEDRATPKVSH